MADVIEPDELDRRLIAAIAEDPRRSYVALGKSLEVSGTTVATRLERLRRAGVVLFRAEPNLSLFGLGTRIWGTIQSEIGALPGLRRRLAESPYVLLVDQVTGEFDLTFYAAFPSNDVLGDLVRELQSVEGVRRFVVHHVVETVKREDGWEAVFQDGKRRPQGEYEIVSGTRVEPQLQDNVALAARWIHALVHGDMELLEELSDPAIVYRIVRPRAVAGTYEGIEELKKAAKASRRAYREFWYRIVGVQAAAEPFDLVIDAMSPVEDANGRILTAVSRLAYGIRDGKVSQAASLGQMELEDLAVLDPSSPTETGVVGG